MFTGTAALGTQQLTTATPAGAALVCGALVVPRTHHAGAGQLSDQGHWTVSRLLDNIARCHVDVCVAGLSPCKVEFGTSWPSQQPQTAWFQHHELSEVKDIC